MDKEIQYEGKRLYYRLSGNGPCVVLLHGFGEDGLVWQEQANALNDYTLLIPDLPGSGRSEMSSDMSLEGLAESVRFILDNEHLARCTLIGHSMGGYITLAFAEKYPEMLEGFGLFHSTAFADSDEKKAARRKGIQTIQQKGPYAFLQTVIPSWFSNVTQQNNPTLIQEQVTSARGFSAEALIAYYEAMIQRPGRTKVLQQNKIPVLFVLGKLDSIVPLQEGLKQAHLPDLSYIHVLYQSAHMGMREEPQESNTLLLDYLSSLVKEFSIQ